MAISITPENHEAEIKKSGTPVVLDIYATWCGPCQQMNPTLDELEKELGDQYKFAKLNVDEAREISIKEYGVTSVPTFVFIFCLYILSAQILRYIFEDKNTQDERWRTNMMNLLGTHREELKMGLTNGKTQNNYYQKQLHLTIMHI